MMPNYTTNIPLQNKEFNAFDVGAKMGKSLEGVGTALATIGKTNKADETKTKIDSYIMAYNNANDQTIFGGLTGSARTNKLARLLLPLDADLSATYLAKAQNESKMEATKAENQKVVEARSAVPTTEEIDVSGDPEVIAEIKLIESELERLKSEKNSPIIPDYSAMPAVDIRQNSRYNINMDNGR